MDSLMIEGLAAQLYIADKGGMWYDATEAVKWKYRNAASDILRKREAKPSRIIVTARAPKHKMVGAPLAVLKTRIVVSSQGKAKAAKLKRLTGR